MDDGLKQRLVGAIVLVAIAVLFLPGLLDRGGRRAVDMTSQIPSEPSEPLEMLELQDPEQPQGIPAAKPVTENYDHPPAEPTPSEDDLPPQSPDSVGDTESPEPEPEPPDPAPSLNEEGIPEAWSLQVASFQSSERAQALLAKLRDEGYKSYIRKAENSQGRVNRVFVGPKVSRSDAEAEKQVIDERFDTDALLVQFKP